MIALSGRSYEDKCAKVANAAAHLSEGRGLLSDLLAAIDPALLPEDEGIISKIEKHFAKAQQSLETF